MARCRDEDVQGAPFGSEDDAVQAQMWTARSRRGGTLALVVRGESHSLPSGTENRVPAGRPGDGARVGDGDGALTAGSGEGARPRPIPYRIRSRRRRSSMGSGDIMEEERRRGAGPAAGSGGVVGVVDGAWRRPRRALSCLR